MIANMTLKKKCFIAIGVLVFLCILVIATAVSLASTQFRLWGQLVIPSQFIDQIVAIFLVALIGVFVVMIVAMVVIGTLLIRSVLVPLDKLYTLANEIKNGNLDCVVETNTHDEFGRVFGEFDNMRVRLKQSLETLNQQDMNRKDMVMNIAHDIKTPVTAICGHTEGLLDGIADTPEKQRKYLGIIMEKALVVNQMVNDLYLFAKLDVQQMNLKMEDTSLLPLVAQVYEHFTATYPNVTKELVVGATGSPCVSLDHYQFKRVLENINENARKHCKKEQLHLTIAIYDNKELPNHVVMKVTDNGVGVPPNACDQLFERFYRNDPGRTTSGSGLGLSIAKQLVEAMGGKIWARCLVGQGLSVYMSFPTIPNERVVK